MKRKSIAEFLITSGLSLNIDVQKGDQIMIGIIMATAEMRAIPRALSCERPSPP